MTHDDVTADPRGPAARFADFIVIVSLSLLVQVTSLHIECIWFDDLPRIHQIFILFLGWGGPADMSYMIAKRAKTRDLILSLPMAEFRVDLDSFVV